MFIVILSTMLNIYNNKCISNLKFKLNQIAATAEASLGLQKAIYLS